MIRLIEEHPLVSHALQALVLGLLLGWIAPIPVACLLVGFWYGREAGQAWRDLQRAEAFGSIEPMSSPKRLALAYALDLDVERWLEALVPVVVTLVVTLPWIPV